MSKNRIKIITVLFIGILIGVGAFFAIKKSAAKSVMSARFEQQEASNTPEKNNTQPTQPSDISKIPILTYHSFGPKPKSTETKMQLHYRITSEMFDAQMKQLSDKGYHTITFADLVENQTTGKPLPDHAIVLTFDDGWKSQYQYAVPILEKYKFTGTFFIITNSIDAKSYMSVDELKDLHAKGFEIASHTKSHPKLPTLGDVQLVQEIQGSKKTLEDKLGITITTLAYPYYAHDVRVMQAVQNAGYKGARAGWGNFVNDTKHLFELKSQESVNSTDPFSEKRIPD